MICKAEKDACRAFPKANGDGLRPGPPRNFQMLDPLACTRWGRQRKVIAFIEPRRGP